jgi:hypothetical protein
VTPFRCCPHCESRRFLPGPRGGSSLNVLCAGCSARYNLLIQPYEVWLIDPISAPTGSPPNFSGAAYLIELIHAEP